MRLNEEICHCKHVYFADIENALHDCNTMDEVEKTFEHVKDVTHCSTGCGGCHNHVMCIISELMHK